MKRVGLWRRLLAGRGKRKGFSGEGQLKKQVGALYAVLANIYGSDKLVIRAGKLDAVHLLRSPILEERVLGLEKLVFEDPTLSEAPPREKVPEILNEIEEELAELIARRTVEDKLEKKVNERMQTRHEDYLREIKMQILKEEGPADTAFTLKKLEELQKMEERRLACSALEILRPHTAADIVGQDRALAALFAKIASPYPQHVIIYGPPGVGKTSVARLALEEAKRLPYTPFAKDAPFVEVDGATLRWDPREVSNPLLGSVHDPIYQGAKRDLVENAIPEPKLGLVSEANGGILFIDEIGELDPMLQNKLLKVLEDKRVTFDSAYYDPEDPTVPKYIKKLFEEGAPADFILVGATTRDPAEINPALRSRCAEVFFEPLTPRDIQVIVRNAARKLQVELDAGVAELISDYTIEGRKAVNILADAFGIALYRQQKQRYKQEPLEQNQGQEPGYEQKQKNRSLPPSLRITQGDILEVIQASRLTPYLTTKASESAEIGKIFGLGVSNFVGSLIELEAVAFPAREKGHGQTRFNETAGSMAKDSVFNAASVVRRLTGEDLHDYDLHVNVIGGGLIDGPSAGLAVVLALISAIRQYPIRQNVAVTGEVSIRGQVKAVGGIPEKLYGARQARIKQVLVPRENLRDVPQDLDGVEVIPVATVEEAMGLVFQMEAVEGTERRSLPSPLSADTGSRAETIIPPLPRAGQVG